MHNGNFQLLASHGNTNMYSKKSIRTHMHQLCTEAVRITARWKLSAQWKRAKIVEKFKLNRGTFIVSGLRE